MTSSDAPSFADAWAAAQTVTGWMTQEQGRLLWDAAMALGPGATIVEIGSHQGRSTVILGRAAQHVGARVVAIDPFVEGRLFGGQPTRTIFEKNVREAGLDDVVELRPTYSTELRPTWSGSIDLLYIDGKHDYWTVTDDFKWAEHVVPDGAVLVHDCYSSIGVTLSVLAHVLPGRSLRYESRGGSMALFRVGDNDADSRRRIVAELPWWLRNVGIKVLLRARLRPIAAKFGHDGPYDPY
ncbi:class I SAM-dependent methyltransferase [Barrientosiimonas humi]|uniref:class I SAM-dependent methyltransferase n=1 Tax=Barrientosiimonas humi TaxID=999931 RepID=UPI00370D50E5